MNLFTMAYSLFVIIAVALLHVDEGRGIYTKLGLDWLYPTYQFYFEPIYEALPPMVYFVGLVLVVGSIPFLLLARRVAEGSGESQA